MKDRVTVEDLDDKIVGEQYHLFPGTTTTVCCLNLENGFTVVGESACAHPGLFDKELGEQLARARAKEKIWPLEGYLLREHLNDPYPNE